MKTHPLIVRWTKIRKHDIYSIVQYVKFVVVV